MKTKPSITQGGKEEGQGVAHGKGYILDGDGVKKVDGLGTSHGHVAMGDDDDSGGWHGGHTKVAAVGTF